MEREKFFQKLALSDLRDVVRYSEVFLECGYHNAVPWKFSKDNVIKWKDEIISEALIIALVMSASRSYETLKKINYYDYDCEKFNKLKYYRDKFYAHPDPEFFDVNIYEDGYAIIRRLPILDDDDIKDLKSIAEQLIVQFGGMAGDDVITLRHE